MTSWRQTKRGIIVLLGNGVRRALRVIMAWPFDAPKL